jgi:hypothetical protein
VAPSLGALLVNACEYGFALTYQLHLRPIAPEAGWLRAARRNVLALAALPGAPASLIQWQERRALALGNASALCEEFLAVDEADAASRVSARLGDSFRARYGEYGFADPGFRFVEGAHEDSLLLGLHSHDVEPFSPIDLCSAAVTLEERQALLDWQPSRDLLRLVASPEACGRAEEHEDEALAPGAALLPEPCSEGAFAFISYKRQDFARIAPILRAIVHAGVPVWYDRGIPGGAEWDAIIEERLTACRWVILFVSPAAVASKYVRREVKFADALDTPLIPVLLEDTPLNHGMRMLLAPRQMVDSRDRDFNEQLRRALAGTRRA